jgi:hypothetical protein
LVPVDKDIVIAPVTDKRSFFTIHLISIRGKGTDPASKTLSSLLNKDDGRSPETEHSFV